MYDLGGKRVLLTGGAGGLGLEMARLAVRRGALPILADIDGPGLERAVEELRPQVSGGEPLALLHDLSLHRERERLAEALDSMGVDVDILVNNAATTRLGSFHESSWEDVSMVMGLNLDAVVHLCHLFAPKMVARRQGAILNISSTSAFVPCPGMLCYSGTKAFVNNFSETLRLELKGHGVVVRHACPGATRTAFFSASGLDALDYVSNVPMMEPAWVAEQCLSMLDRPAGGEVIGMKNKLNMLAARLLPRRVLGRLAERRFR